MAEQIIPLEFGGGLNTSRHESKIADSEVSVSSNVIVEDGIVRLDPRYVATADLDGPWVGKGVGFGTYLETELYAVALWGKERDDIQGHPRPNTSKIFTVDADDPSELVPIPGSNTGYESQWYFKQFLDKMYAVNEDAGLFRFTIGQDDWSRLLQPTAPANGPATSMTAGLLQSTFTSGTIANSGLASAVLTNGELVCTSTTPGVKSVTLTFNTQPNFEYRDILSMFTRSIPFLTPDLWLIQGSAETESIIWKRSTQVNKYRVQNIARSNRNLLTKIKVQWEAPAGTFVMRIAPPVGWGVWLSLDRDYNPGEGNNPVFKPLKYEYTYYSETQDLESPPSPSTVVSASSQSPNGDWVTLTGARSSQVDVSHVRFYRVISGVRYLIGEVGNAGTPTVTDKLTEDEVLNQTQYRPSSLDTVGITGITAWQNRLVLSVGSLVYVSATDNPLYFENIDGAYNNFDPARGITFYPDDNRSEIFWGCVAQDELYMVSKYSVRALVGNSADNWRLIKLADSEGAVGPRAFAPFKKGVIVLTPEGRLMYHNVGLIEPEELSEKVRPRAGNLGLKELALSDSIVSVTQRGDIEIRDSLGNYMTMNPDGVWRGGVHTHPTVATSFVSGRNPRWVGEDGRFYEGGDTSYDTDAGEEVFGTLTTKRYLIDRVAVTNLFFGNTPDKTVDGVVYPLVTVNTDRDPEVVSKIVGKKNKHVSVRSSGQGLMFDVTITKDTPLHEFRVTVEKISEARHL